MLFNLFLIVLCCDRINANSVLNFTIDYLWNSLPISDHVPVRLSLSSSADQSHLIIDIDAPFFNNTPPSLEPPGPFQGLWDYEVVELFFLSSVTNHYIELEFSPHGHYLVLLLIERRKVLKDLLPLPSYSAELLPSGRWIGRAHIPRAHLPAHIDRFNAYAIHGEKDNRTYEALYPAPLQSDKPDFHRLELFQPLNFSLLLELDKEDGESWKSDGTSFFISPYISSLIFFVFVLLNA